MTLTADKMYAGMDLTDLLPKNMDETAGCRGNHSWGIVIDETLNPEASAADDFLDTLLGGSESSSAAASPLWSPCTTDSGINEDLPTDPMEYYQQPPCPAFPGFDKSYFPQTPPLKSEPIKDEEKPHVAINLDLDSGDRQEQFGIAFYLTANHTNPPMSVQALTVKDLLLSNLTQKSQQGPQNSLQELILNEDEKKLLAKEGVNLPNKLPLSKFEERVLKKIRRKIRNKHSAQESRKKKREYVDSLEERMSACHANNLELQRKIQKLEETNNALLEQLSQLQPLLPYSSSKTAHRGTCILVLLLSFSLIISSHLQPEPYSLLGQEESTLTRMPTRSLLSADKTPEFPLPPVGGALSVDRSPCSELPTLSPPR